MRKNIINLLILSISISINLTACSQDSPTSIGEYCSYIYNENDSNSCYSSSKFIHRGNYCDISMTVCENAANYYAKALLQDNRDLNNLVKQSVNDGIPCPYDFTDDMKYQDLNKLNLNKKCVDIQNLTAQYYTSGGNYPYIHVNRLQKIYIQSQK